MRHSLLILLAILLFSCGNKPRIYEEVHKIKEQTWIYSDSLDYTFNIQDTSHIYGMGIVVQFSENYPYENIYTRIKTILPNGDVRDNLFSIELQKPEKRRSLTCSSKYCTIDVFLQAPLKFIDTGDYTIRIFQFTRDDSLKGISNVGLYVEKLESIYKEK